MFIIEHTFPFYYKAKSKTISKRSFSPRYSRFSVLFSPLGLSLGETWTFTYRNSHFPLTKLPVSPRLSWCPDFVLYLCKTFSQPTRWHSYAATQRHKQNDGVTQLRSYTVSFAFLTQWHCDAVTQLHLPCLHYAITLLRSYICVQQYFFFNRYILYYYIYYNIYNNIEISFSQMSQRIFT